MHLKQTAHVRKEKILAIGWEIYIVLHEIGLQSSQRPKWGKKKQTLNSTQDQKFFYWNMGSNFLISSNAPLKILR